MKKLCRIENCNKPLWANGLCGTHNMRRHRNMPMDSKVRRYRGPKNNTSRGYKRVYWNDGSYTYEHVLIAQKALGRRLKFPEQVHHLDGDGLNNHSSNLVVCPDMAYHQLLHKRSRQNEAT